MYMHRIEKVTIITVACNQYHRTGFNCVPAFTRIIIEVTLFAIVVIEYRKKLAIRD